MDKTVLAEKQRRLWHPIALFIFVSLGISAFGFILASLVGGGNPDSLSPVHFLPEADVPSYNEHPFLWVILTSSFMLPHILIAIYGRLITLVMFPDKQTLLRLVLNSLNQMALMSAVIFGGFFVYSHLYKLGESDYLAAIRLMWTWNVLFWIFISLSLCGNGIGAYWQKIFPRWLSLLSIMCGISGLVTVLALSNPETSPALRLNANMFICAIFFLSLSSYLLIKTN